MKKIRTLARQIFANLPKSILYEIFYQSARALGVRSYEVSGSVGTFFGPVYDQSIIKTYLKTGIWSENITGLFQNFFKNSGGTMYDIGANIGLVSIPIAQNPNISVVAFEPDPHNCSLLRANASTAGVNLNVVNAAVASKSGFLNFTRSEYNCGDHRLSKDGDLSVRAVSLIDYIPNVKPFAVKIDTQGAEPLIFEGGESVLAEAELIVSEFWPWGMRRMSLDPEIILTFAQRYFDVGLVLKHDEPIKPLIPISEVICQLRAVISAGNEYDEVDVILVRSSAWIR